MFISINNRSFVSISELNQVLVSCLGTEDQFAEIQFTNNVERIDVAFIGGLFLFYRETSVRLHLKGREKDGKVFHSLRYTAEVKQLLAQFVLLYQVDSKWIRIEGLLSNHSDLFRTALFSPIIFVDENTLDSFFLTNNNSYFSILQREYSQSLVNGRNQLEKLYFSELTDNHILARLNENPPIYTFVYCILHSIERPFTNSGGLDDSLNRIEYLWALTNEYVSALYELAKNIVFHSSTQRGIISIGSYGTKELNSRELETYVFDFGKQGIIPTLYRKLDLSLEEDRQDKDIIGNGYTLKDFFAPGKSRRLFRQIRRGMAHLGLIHFISLIETNSGGYGISTEGLSGVREYYGNTEYSDHFLKVGTNFYFSLHVKKKEEIVGINVSDPTAAALPKESLAAMPRVFEIRKDIETVVLKQMDVKSRDDEQAVVDQVSFSNENKHYYAIDFSLVTALTAPSLLRILALLSERTYKNVIVFNISTKLYSRMVISNDTYFRSNQVAKELNGRVPFWIKDRAILVYSREKEGDPYFADILYGDDQSSFLHLNRIIHNTFPNYCTIAIENYPTEAGDNNVVFNNAVNPFFRQSSLLPFDIVICNSSGSRLFDDNLTMLVNKPLM